MAGIEVAAVDGRTWQSGQSRGWPINCCRLVDIDQHMLFHLYCLPFYDVIWIRCWSSDSRQPFSNIRCQPILLVMVMSHNSINWNWKLHIGGVVHLWSKITCVSWCVARWRRLSLFATDILSILKNSILRTSPSASVCSPEKGSIARQTFEADSHLEREPVFHILSIMFWYLQRKTSPQLTHSFILPSP